MSDDPVKPILLVKKKDAKKGSLWQKLTNSRIIKQHGGYDIPEDDLHAIPKFQSPVDRKPESPEETKEVLSDLEREIQQLKEKDSQASLPQNTHEAYYEEPRDDSYDDDYAE